MINKNPLAEYLIFDLGGHRYTKPCVDYIKKQYPSTKITEVYGDTNITLKEYVKSNEKHTFDMIHIDGGHDTPTVINDFTYTQDLLTSDGVVIFDDYNYENIKRVIDNYKLEGVIYPYKENLVETNLHYVYKFNNKNK
jgi:predicted O-methyltransferase YrrM